MANISEGKTPVKHVFSATSSRVIITFVFGIKLLMREVAEMFMEEQIGAIREVLADPYVVGDAWDITSIPRFLLIDENFKIINAFAPRPSDREKIEPLLAR